MGKLHTWLGGVTLLLATPALHAQPPDSFGGSLPPVPPAALPPTLVAPPGALGPQGYSPPTSPAAPAGALPGTIPASVFPGNMVPGLTDPGTPPPPAPVVRATQSKRFTIPFTLDRPPAEVGEVRLFVSIDEGKSWQQYAAVAPSVDGRSFTFQTRRDGCYWFASRTVDRVGQVWPQRPLSPELVVHIDTTEPRMQLAAGASNGQLVVRWRAEDPLLAPQTVRFEYRDRAEGTWRPITTTASPGGPGRAEGQFALPLTTRDAEIRVEAADAAGNRQSLVRRVMLPASAVAQLAPATPPTTGLASAAPVVPLASAPRTSLPLDPTQPVTAIPNGLIGGAVAPPTAPGAAGVGLPIDPTDSALAGAAPSSLASTPSAPAQSESWPPYHGVPNVGVPSAPGMSAGGAAAGPGMLAATSPAGSNTAPAAVDSVGLPNSAPTTFHHAVGPTEAPIAGADSTTATEPSTGTSAAGTQAPPDSPQLPGGQTPRMTNRQRLSLDYEVQVGLEEVAEVELWGTDDAGRTWTKWGSDPDRISPLTLKIEDEGVYGFRVVVVNANGLASKTPRPGDEADVWIGVDITPPSLRINSALPGRGPQAGRLDIQWTAADLHFGERPVSLFYSTDATGPWQLIVGDIDNLGRYLWDVGPDVPSRVFLKLTAHDSAGNVSDAVTPEAISLDGVRPQGRIRALAPAP